MGGVVDNQMVKRYPCRNYERLLAAKALPMTKESLKRKSWKSSLFYHYQPIEANLKLRMYLILTREEISKNSFYYIQNVCILSYIRIFLFDKMSM